MIDPELERRAALRACDECEAALRQFPLLSEVYDGTWVAGHREEIRNAAEPQKVGWPAPFGFAEMSRWNGTDDLVGFQQRIEQALAIVKRLVPPTEWRALMERLRHHDSGAATDELLLVFGFASVFGEAALVWPASKAGLKRPEFYVRTNAVELGVECKTLLYSVRDQSTFDTMLTSGEGQVGPARSELHRLRRAIVEKIRAGQAGGPWVLVLSQLTWHVFPADAIAAIESILAEPTSEGLDVASLPSAIGYVTGHHVQGVWFNPRTDAGLYGRVDEAIHAAYWPMAAGR